MATKTRPAPVLAGAIGAVKALEEFEDALPGSKRGRPKGAKNVEVDIVEAPPTACRKCGSTARAPYFNRREVAVSGLCTQTKQPYTSIIYRRTKCLDCGQHRDDRTLVNEPARQRVGTLNV